MNTDTDPRDRSPKTPCRGEDRWELAQLFNSYAYHFDRNEPEAVAALFTADTLIDYGPEVAPIRGRDAIVPRIAPGLNEIFDASSHHISNITVTFEGEDIATGMAYVYAWVRYKESSPDANMWGQYHCRFERTSEGWRIAELVLRVAGVTNFHRSAVHPIGRKL